MEEKPEPGTPKHPKPETYWDRQRAAYEAEVEAKHQKLRETPDRLLLEGIRWDNRAWFEEALELGAEVSPRLPWDLTPLIAAVSHDRTQMTARLIELGAEVNQRHEGWTALHAAAFKSKDPAIVRQLLEAGADPQALSSRGDSPLVYACRRKDGDPTIAKLLLERHGDLDPDDPPGQTPLQAASQAGHVPVVRWLIEMGVPLDTPHQGDLFSGWTALTYAVAGGHKDVVARLLRAGADPQVRTKSGETLLMLAADKSSPKICSLLISRGVDPAAKADSGLTAYDYAERRERGLPDPKILALLRLPKTKKKRRKR